MSNDHAALHPSAVASGSSPPLQPDPQPHLAPIHAAPILVTGFDPFDGADINPSWEVARSLHGLRIGQAAIIAAQLPTVFALSLAHLSALMEQHQPQLIVCLGLAGGRSAISVERVAINVIDARIPDNHGAQPVDVPVFEGAPAAYFSTLPIKAIRQAIESTGLPAEISQTAGTFVCNQVMFGALHIANTVNTAGLAARAGLIHLPWTEGLGEPALPQAAMVEAIYQALVAALDHPTDLPVAGGATH